MDKLVTDVGLNWLKLSIQFLDSRVELRKITELFKCIASNTVFVLMKGLGLHQSNPKKDNGQLTSVIVLL